jgi:hypothetical protein
LLDPPFAKLIRGRWFATVVVMSERSTEQIRESLDFLYRGRLLGKIKITEQADQSCQDSSRPATRDHG